MRIVDIPINQLKRDSNQPRQTLDSERIKELAQSILTEGVINPIEVDKDNVIITGEMRWRAAKLAKLKTIPCKLITINPEKRFRRQVIENIHHNTMTDWDTAKALQKLLDGRQATIRSSKEHKGGKPDKGIRELGRMIGKGQTYIIEKLDLLHASPSFQIAVQKGLPNSFIRGIKRAPEEFKAEIEKRIIRGDYRTRDEVLEIANALKRNPEKADEILKAKPSQITTIAPRIADQIRESYNPVNELSDIVDSLVAWLTKNPAASIGSVHAPRIILNLSGAVQSINEWSGRINQVTLKGNSDGNFSNRQS